MIKSRVIELPNADEPEKLCPSVQNNFGNNARTNKNLTVTVITAGKPKMFDNMIIGLQMC